MGDVEMGLRSAPPPPSPQDTCQDDSVSVISSLYYCPGQEPPVSPRSRLSSYSSTLQRSFASFERSKSASGHDEMNAAAAAAAHAQATVEALSKEDSELKSSSRSRTASSARGSYGRLGKRKEMPTNAKRAPMWEGYVTAEDHNRRVVTIHSSTYAFRMFLFFSVMTFSTNVTTGVFNQVLNPVLVNHFHLEFGAVSLVCALLPCPLPCRSAAPCGPATVLLCVPLYGANIHFFSAKIIDSRRKA